MKNTKRKLNNQTKIVKVSFTGSNITRFAGLNTIAKYMNRQNIVQAISSSFPTIWYNATRFGINQILMAITLSSISGISRLCRIAAFSGDGLVKSLLKLDKAINENALSAALKNLGQVGARKLQTVLLSKNSRWLRESGLESITLDADSPRKISLRLSKAILRGETVKSVCGNQEGAEKGFNTTKKGAKSYHPLLVFVSEMKLLYHTWFRTGSAYTANGIVDFLKEVKASLPKNIREVFFRADSGFFSGELFDLLESYNWNYLVKVKLKNLENLLQSQTWVELIGKNYVAICEFSYKAKGWNKPRMLKAMRTVKEYVQVSYLGQEQIVPVYQYVCYISSYDMDAVGLHELYKQLSTSEFCDEKVQSKLVLNWRTKKQNLHSKTWIEQVKGHTMAGSTLTDDFWANDILWQLSVLAYNISVMMRQKKNKFKKQEHRSFIDWFIAVPAKITKSGHQIEIKMYENHFYKDAWVELDKLIEAA